MITLQASVAKARLPYSRRRVIDADQSHIFFCTPPPHQDLPLRNPFCLLFSPLVEMIALRA